MIYFFNRCLRFLPAISVVAVALLFAPMAHAAVLLSQTDDSGSCVADGGGCSGQYTLITASTNGVPASVSFEVTLATAGMPFFFQVGGPGNSCTATGTLPTITSPTILNYPCQDVFNNIVSGTQYSATFSQAGFPTFTAATNNLPNGSGFNWYFVLYDSAGPPPVDTSTRLISVSPGNGTTTATTTTVNWVGYVNSSDFASSTQVVGNYSSPNCSSVSVSAIQAVNGTCSFNVILPVSSSGLFSLSTTTVFQYPGVWNYVVTLENANAGYCVFGVCLFGSVTDLGQLSGSFIQGHEGPYDVIQSYVQQSSTTLALAATSTQGLSNLCNPFEFGSFDVTSCLSLLFIPTSQEFNGFFQGVSGQFLTYAPWGYVTRFVNIVDGDVSTTTLPRLAFTVPSSVMYGVNPFPVDMQGSSWDFTFWDAESTSSILSTQTDNIDGKTFYQIFSPYWDIIWAVGLTFVMVFDIFGLQDDGADSDDPLSEPMDSSRGYH